MVPIKITIDKRKVFMPESIKDGALWPKLIEKAYAVYRKKGLEPVNFKTDLEVTMREKNGKKYYFVINFTGKEQPLPNCFNGCVNLLSDECLAHDRTVKPFESFVIEQ